MRGEVENWVHVAVAFFDGEERMASELGVSPQQVREWLRRGTMRTVAYETVAKVASLVPVSIDKLTGDPSREQGFHNSSVTRVWPVLLRLIHADPTGTTWVPTILELASRNRWSPDEPVIGQAALSSPLEPGLVGRPSGSTLSYGFINLHLPRCFEFELPPPRRLVRYLIENAGRTWKPREKLSKEAMNAGQRKQLFDRNPALAEKARVEALSELEQVGVVRPYRKWWLFEGPTSVDCLLESERYVVLIEGKRNDTLARYTTWLEKRHQLARNLECAQERAAGKEFAVVVIGEKQMEVAIDDLDESFPHLSEREQDELLQHYAGSLTWGDLCSKTGLGDAALPPDVLCAIDDLLREGLV